MVDQRDRIDDQPSLVRRASAVAEAAIVDSEDVGVWQTAQAEVGVCPPALSDVACIAMEVDHDTCLGVTANDFGKVGRRRGSG